MGSCRKSGDSPHFRPKEIIIQHLRSFMQVINLSTLDLYLQQKKVKERGKAFNECILNLCMPLIQVHVSTVTLCLLSTILRHFDAKSDRTHVLSCTCLGVRARAFLRPAPPLPPVTVPQHFSNFSLFFALAPSLIETN